MSPELAPVFLDNERVSLEGDPQPNISKILEAAGKETDNMQVIRQHSKEEESGDVLSLQSVLDRAVDKEAIYLRLEETSEGEGDGEGKDDSEGATAEEGTETTAPSGGTMQRKTKGDTSDDTEERSASAEPAVPAEEESAEHNG